MAENKRKRERKLVEGPGAGREKRRPCSFS